MNRPPEPPDSDPLLTVVIVTWNSASEIASCLAAIEQSTLAPHVCCIVVDNSSQDDTASIVRGFPDAVLRVNDANLGFSKASNQGIALATSPYVMLLNPDTVVAADALEKLVDHIRDNPSTGMCGPTLMGADGRVQATCARRLPNLRYSFVEDGLRLPGVPALSDSWLWSWQYPYDTDRTQPVEAISGAAMLIRREVVDEIGSLDPLYRHCGEDVDLCARVRKAGWRIDFVAPAKVLHLGSVSSRKAPNRVAMEVLVSNHRYFRIHGGRWHAFFFRLTIAAVRAPVSALGGLIQFAWRRDRRLLRQRLALVSDMLLLRPYTGPED